MKLFLCFLVTCSFLSAEEAKFCRKCQKVNEWNAKHQNQYEYYEDWLKHQDEQEKSPFLEEGVDFNE